MRNILAIMLLVAIGTGFYVYRGEQSGERVKVQMRGVIDDMALSPEWRGEVRRFFDTCHETAFHAAMDVSKKLGRKFDSKKYYDMVFDEIIERAREGGHDDLAERLAQEKNLFRLVVVEE